MKGLIQSKTRYVRSEWREGKPGLYCSPGRIRDRKIRLRASSCGPCRQIVRAVDSFTAYVLGKPDAGNPPVRFDEGRPGRLISVGS
jgi:hypothetical protein